MERLRMRLDAWQRRGDGRARYLSWYAHTTDDVLAAVARNRFADSEWVRRLVEQLADHYLMTVETAFADLGLVTPPAWKAAHLVAARPSVSAAQTIRLGLNAHINNDLPRATAALLFADWPLSNVRLERHYQDLCMYTDVMAIGAGMVDVMACWRTESWQQALALTTAVNPPWRDAVGEEIACAAARRAHLIACDIPMADHLLGIPTADLNRLFPHRHEGVGCRLGDAPPVWGGGRVAATAP
jgi:hypothetical protein